MGYIYKLTSPSGKAYIGQTVLSMEERIKAHLRIGSQCKAVKRAIDKYGAGNMMVEILMEVPNDLLNHYEVKAIDVYGTYGPRGYNMTPGGDTPPLKCPEIAARLKETMARPEVKAKLSKAQKINHARPGAKEKRSEALKQAHARPETKARFKAAWKLAQGKPEAREKQRVAQRKAHKDPEIHKARMAGLATCRNDPIKQKARAEAIKAGHARRKAALYSKEVGKMEAYLSNGTMTSEMSP